MLRSYQILVSHFSLCFAVSAVILAPGLVGCGQTGALYLPTEAAAAQRATLPQTLKPNTPVKPSSATTPKQPAPAQ